MHYVELHGQALDRGHQYGSTCREEIGDALDRWQRYMHVTYGISFQAYIDYIWQNKFYYQEIKRYAPDMLIEVEGISAGARMPLPLIYAWQLADEHPFLMTQFKQASNLKVHINIEREGCSTIIAKQHGYFVVGQNLDIPYYKNNLQTVLSIRPDDGPRQLVCSQMGMIGSFALNHGGLGIGVNSLPQLKSSLDGVPVSYMLRCLAVCENVKHAAAKLRRIPHASGQNYALVDDTEAAYFESCMDQVQRTNVPEGTWLFHTNHLLCNWSEDYLEKSVDPSRSSVQRYATIDSMAVEAAEHEYGLEDVLSASPVHVKGLSPGAAHTFASVVMHISPCPHMVFIKNSEHDYSRYDV